MTFGPIYDSQGICCMPEKKHNILEVNGIEFNHEFNMQRGGRLYTSTSSVCRRQILTSKVDPRTKRVKYL